MFEAYKRKAQALLPAKAFIRADRGSRLFMTDANRFADPEAVLRVLEENGFTAEIRGGCVAFSPASVIPEMVEAMKTDAGRGKSEAALTRYLHERDAEALRLGDAEHHAAIAALIDKRRVKMKLTYLGHSCFRLENSQGHTCVTDPFDAHVGYPVPACHADIVTVSHGHGDHNYTAELTGEKTVFTAPGTYEKCGFTITGYPSFHDDAQGAKRGLNTIFRIEADGLRVVHLGDLGHMPDDALIDALAGADVLLVPIGGFYTINTKQAVEIINRIKPKLTVGMHFKAAGNSFPITDASEFIRLTGARTLPSDSLDLPAAGAAIFPIPG